MKTKQHKVQFSKWECTVVKENYQDNNRIALCLIDKDGDDIAIATTNLPDEPLEENEVIIKDWSENEGMYDALLSAGIISKYTRLAATGFVTAKICKLLI